MVTTIEDRGQLSRQEAILFDTFLLTLKRTINRNKKKKVRHYYIEIKYNACNKLDLEDGRCY